MELFEKTLTQKYVYKGKIINTRVDTAELPDGKTCTREVIEHNGGVTVAALTDEGELLFVRQFRYPYSLVVLELPAGKLDKGEDPLEAGRRELREETGAQAEKFIDLGIFYPSPGYCGEIIHLFAATGLKFGDMCLDEDEYLTVDRIPLEAAAEMVLRGEVPDGKTQAAVLKVAILVREGRLK